MFPRDEDDFPTLNIQWVEEDSDDTLYRYWISDITFQLPSWADVTYKTIDYFIQQDQDDDQMNYATMDDDDDPKYYGTGDPDFHMTRISDN
jgi:hypothetical protein